MRAAPFSIEIDHDRRFVRGFQHHCVECIDSDERFKPATVVGHDGWLWATLYPDSQKRQNGNHGRGEKRNMHEGLLDYSVGNTFEQQYKLGLVLVVPKAFG